MCCFCIFFTIWMAMKANKIKYKPLIQIPSGKFLITSIRNSPAKVWFSYIVIYRRCPCGFIVGDQWWTKSFVFLKSFSPSVISHNRSAMKCDELRYMKTRLNGHYMNNLIPWLVDILSVNLPRGKSPQDNLGTLDLSNKPTNASARYFPAQHKTRNTFKAFANGYP